MRLTASGSPQERRSSTFLQTDRQSLLLIKIQDQIDPKTGAPGAFVSRTWRRISSMDEQEGRVADHRIAHGGGKLRATRPPMEAWMIGTWIANFSQDGSHGERFLSDLVSVC